MQETLALKQPVEQVGFRSGLNIEDHILTIITLIEKVAEFNAPLWIAAIDFQKAFDTVEHDSAWKALANAGIPGAYVRALATIYEGQFGIVVDEEQGRPFKIRRGTKQGDPLSPAVFNSVLQEAFEQVIPRWHARKYGSWQRCKT
jgi:hypothetical protein